MLSFQLVRVLFNSNVTLSGKNHIVTSIWRTRLSPQPGKPIFPARRLARRGCFGYTDGEIITALHEQTRNKTARVQRREFNLLSLKSPSRAFWRPSASKLSGLSHASKAKPKWFAAILHNKRAH